MSARDSLVERVFLRLSREQLQALDVYCKRFGEDRSGFIRRILLKELRLLGFFQEERRQSLAVLLRGERDKSSAFGLRVG